ncbi:MAG: Eco57I restriction-modification methylase domain-containing protein [Deltaproteobacteria bacterium]|nr:Eco57I restriction-modification methylase domain-containing protein [Deltaproteobacteria bacterium]
MIGRLLFCWFLKKKTSYSNGLPLIPQTILSSEAVEQYKNYYHTILEPLFFEVLNTPVDKRKKEFKVDPWASIPFLNGGLFEPHLHDFYEPGALGVSKHINTLKIPDIWFKELFEVFETYNFTIDENTSIDIDLSVDPEMLGRIFGNLLAEINPETGETARKATGSYYTPRPIVEYMVDESLKQYLITQTGISEDKLSRLISYGDTETELTESEKDSIIDALDRLKIIDPACGSGAFPMGILQKMLLILQRIDPESKKWLSKKLEKIESKVLRDEAERKLKNENWDYVHKLGIIQSSIYGVDIQPIATEISKLRFFHSLIVDEKVDDTKPNRGVEPLPNLEFKFVCANSLIGLPTSDGGFSESPKDIKSLRNLRESYFTSYGDEKRRIEREFIETQKRMFEHAINWGAKDTQTLRLSQWNPFSNEPSPWFDPEWMFGVRDGFNVVIANPPYLRVDDINPLSREKYKYHFKTAVGKYDLYYLFFEKAFLLLNKVGICVFISPNKFCAASSAENLREIILNSISSGEILSTSQLKIFESASNYPIISILEFREPRTRNFTVRQAESLQLLYSINSKNSYSAGIRDFDIFPYKVIPINIPQNTFILIKRLFSESFLLGDLLNISEGLRIPKKLESESKQDFEIAKQYQFSKYSDIKPGSYISSKNLSKVISNTSDRYEKIFQEKILIAEDALQISATLDVDFRIPQGGVYFATSKTNSFELKFLLGLLNSYLLSYIYEVLYAGMHMGGGYLRYRSIFLEGLPIPKKLFNSGDKMQTTVMNLVDRILSITKNNHYLESSTKQAKVKEYERQIDQMVYELYGLTDEEIRIVEGKR